MNPLVEDLIMGSDLRVGMVVLIENDQCRLSVENTDSWAPYNWKTALQYNRWTTVERLVPGGFIGAFEDDTKALFQRDDASGWYVKKDSIPEKAPKTTQDEELARVFAFEDVVLDENQIPRFVGRPDQVLRWIQEGMENHAWITPDTPWVVYCGETTHVTPIQTYFWARNPDRRMEVVSSLRKTYEDVRNIKQKENLTEEHLELPPDFGNNLPSVISPEQMADLLGKELPPDHMSEWQRNGSKPQ